MPKTKPNKQPKNFTYSFKSRKEAAIFSIITTSIILLLAATYQLYARLPKSQTLPQKNNIISTLTPQPESKQAAKKPRDIYIFEATENGLIPLNQISAIPPKGLSKSPIISDTKSHYFIINHEHLEKYSYDQEEVLESRKILTEDNNIPRLHLNHDTNRIWLVTNTNTHLSEYSNTYSIKDIITQTIELRPVYRQFSANYLYSGIGLLGASDNSLFLLDMGADGCGGYGSIATYKDNLYRELKHIGLGCQKGPRQIGYSSVIDSFLLYDADTTTFGNPSPTITRLYSFNPTTNQEKTIKNFSQAYESTTSFILSIKTDQLAIYTENTIEVINLASNQSKQFLLPENIDLTNKELTFYPDNNIYGIDDNRQFLFIINTKNGEVQQIDISEKMKHINPYFHFLGVHNQNPIVYYHTPFDFNRGK